MAHLTLEDRLTIEHMLKNKHSLTEIANTLNKAISTISREIKKHAVFSLKVFPGRIPNRCIHRMSCKKLYLCLDKPNCTKVSCSLCRYCNSVCPDFEEEVCKKLFFPPYVCNGCIDEPKCCLGKHYYIYKTSHKEYRTTLVEVRQGVNITEGELLHLNKFFSPLLKKGQSIHHVCAHNQNELICSEKSMYRYISGGLLSAKNIDLPRVVRMKPRKRKPAIFKIDSHCYINRNYNDFKKYKSEHPDVAVVEMDSVEGKKGGKVLLTLHFKGTCDFMFAFIRDHNNAQSVIDIFDHLYTVLGAKLFCKMFPLIITDRGSEFTNPLALEFDKEGVRRTHVFFCDPQASWQKPNVELNHEFIRRVLPKGTSFDNLTQEDIDFMMNNINSYGREKLNDRSPIEILSFLFGQDTIDRLGVELIPANDIVLHPRLLKK